MWDQTDVRATGATETGTVDILSGAFRAEHFKTLRDFSLRDVRETNLQLFLNESRAQRVQRFTSVLAAVRWRKASKRITPAATETFSD